ncbi:unnamed protein product, partial [Hymenolepis diminuta]
MPASSISRMPSPLAQLPPIQNWLSLYSSLTSTVDFNEIKPKPYTQITKSISPSPSLLAMMFNNKDRRLNLLKEKQTRAKESPNLGTSNAASREKHKFNNFSSNNSTNPPPPTSYDRYYDLSSFSSEDFSFSTNPNDVTSITSSDWGDEACELDRERSHHVQQLFNAIEQMLFDPGWLKNCHLNTGTENLNTSVHPTSSDLISVRNLLPECEEWASKFPHFRLNGLQIRPPQ